MEGRLIRHRTAAEAQPPSQSGLAIGVIRSPLGALLVTSIRTSPTIAPTSIPASLAAVAVAAVARPADRERFVTPNAVQQVQQDADDQPLAQETPSEWTSRRAGGMLPAPKSLPPKEAAFAPCPGRALSGPGRISWTDLWLTDTLPCHGLDYESR